MSQWHYLSDEEITACLKADSSIHRAFGPMDKTQFVVIQIDGTKSATALQTAKSLHKQLKDIDLKPKSFYIEELDLRQIYLFFSEPVKTSQVTTLLHSWLQNNWFSVAADAVTILPSEHPLHVPVQGNFCWLNDDFNSVVKASEIAYMNAISMFMQDLRTNDTSLEHFALALTQTRCLNQPILQSTVADNVPSEAPVADMTCRNDMSEQEIVELGVKHDSDEAVCSIDMSRQHPMSSQEEDSLLPVVTGEKRKPGAISPSISSDNESVQGGLTRVQSAKTLSFNNDAQISDSPSTGSSDTQVDSQLTVMTRRSNQIVDTSVTTLATVPNLTNSGLIELESNYVMSRAGHNQNSPSDDLKNHVPAVTDPITAFSQVTVLSNDLKSDDKSARVLSEINSFPNNHPPEHSAETEYFIVTSHISNSPSENSSDILSESSSTAMTKRCDQIGDNSVTTFAMEPDLTKSLLIGHETNYVMSPVDQIESPSEDSHSKASDCENVTELSSLPVISNDVKCNDMTGNVIDKKPPLASVTQIIPANSSLSTTPNLLQESDVDWISDECKSALVNLVAEVSLPEHSCEAKNNYLSNSADPIQIQNLLLATLDSSGTRSPPVNEIIIGKRRSAKQISSRDGPKQQVRRNHGNNDLYPELYEQLMLPFSSNTS